MQSSSETIRPALNPDWPFKSIVGKDVSGPPLLAYGAPFTHIISRQMEKMFHASRAYVIASASLSKQTDKLDQLKAALGNKLVGLRIGMKPHTYMSEVLEVINDVRRVEGDIIITLGGGSLIDAAKLVSFGLANNVTNNEELKKLPHIMDPLKPAIASKLPVVCVPTTLSAGEFTPYAGVTDDRDNVKLQFCPPQKAPAMVVLDGEVAVTTPLKTWLSTGVRSVDHCVEALLSPTPSTGRVKEADEASIEGLKCLIPGLLQTKKNPHDPAARHTCQLGTPLGPAHILMGISPGASHGIGHMLGPLGVGHGETSCILMPAVHKWNAAHGADMERQKLVCSLLWEMQIAKQTFEARGLSPSTADLGDLLDAFLREIGMPRSLSDFAIGDDRFQELAVNSLRDPLLATNPVPITEPQPVVEILEMCR
ncbi:MAG: hypothetical protein Q9227_009249 [Pyrenula ochraceoflavens]